MLKGLHGIEPTKLEPKKRTKKPLRDMYDLKEPDEEAESIEDG